MTANNHYHDINHRHTHHRHSLDASVLYDENDDAMNVRHNDIELPITGNDMNHHLRGMKRRLIIKNPILNESLFLLVVIGLILCHRKYEKQNYLINNSNQRKSQREQQQHSNFMTDRKSYCYDSDDSHELIQRFTENAKLCRCVNPVEPSGRSGKVWIDHHNTMIQDVLYHHAKQQMHEDDLDFILLGDSITESWNGTKMIGQRSAPEYRTMFDKYFNKYSNNSKASLFGLALGSSGDVSVELLWHLENGILSSSITPKVFVVLIGTNDIGNMKCSKQTVLRAIQKVILTIHHHRPETPVIVHALLPRSDGSRKAYKVGYMYENIVWINRALEQFCNIKANQMWCYYLNVNHIFLDKETTIIKHLMDDALHPTVKGMDAWGPLLVDKITEIIEMNHHNNNVFDTIS